MTNGTKRRLSLVVLAVLLLVIASIFARMLDSVTNGYNIQYDTDPVIEAQPYALCPGETFSYYQAIDIKQTAMIDISREWCNRNGTCSLDLHESWQNVVLTPLKFEGPVTRTVPASPLWKPGGLYEFRSGVQNGDLSVQIVQFSIREDCP